MKEVGGREDKEEEEGRGEKNERGMWEKTG